MRQPDIAPISDSQYRLRENYVYEWMNDGRHNRLVIPKGFVYDGASIPRVFWFFGLRIDGLIRSAALCHDWLYSLSGDFQSRGNRGSHFYYIQYQDDQGAWVEQSRPWTREQADLLFARVMREAGYAKWKRRAAFIAVRLFGWLAWQG